MENFSKYFLFNLNLFFFIGMIIFYFYFVTLLTRKFMRKYVTLLLISFATEVNFPTVNTIEALSKKRRFKGYE